jgi:hypothetical protein
MLSLKKLQSAKINADVAREAYTQVDRYLVDTLEVRKSFEQKAATLMGAFITISLALFGIGGTIFEKTGLGPTVWPFFGTGMIFLAGAWCFICALKAGTYPAVGSRPEMWLTKGVIDGRRDAVPKMLAYLTHYHDKRIDLSIKGNGLKAKWIDRGIYFGAAGPLVFVALFIAFYTLRGTTPPTSLGGIGTGVG